MQEDGENRKLYLMWICDVWCPDQLTDVSAKADTDSTAAFTNHSNC